ncbi:MULTISPECIES: ABC transporter substrate-binding protein [unclassified Rathayibacter]|uniref:ABC transporter substrate-binding protein n=1 Tax=unclassified Rathayibacter TaxID=2609250 RepID=UPI00104EBCD5|nr:MULTISPECIES: ABC transporter substrate-binding protein [unclassified Rathayibacter]TCL82016.1 carbohydrate ABC transporter substrate-binding protein (CUT1 family) [Rathayibacter sp. PhB192]TCM27232.1 carbohydrate ABC transporter substrate-binding protein (CUT1 family) [Rathayibacter sp. PhB179]
MHRPTTRRPAPARRSTLIGLAAVAASASLVLSGCSAGASNDSGEPAGEITVLTNRTDLVDTTFADYASTFEKQYPGTTVKFEALTDYEGDTKIRLNSKDYGDVLLIPSSNVTKDDYANYFEPLGSTDELSEKYRFTNEGSFDGTAYGISTFGSAMGYVFNRDVWSAAGVTDPPQTEEEYLADLEAIKATGVTPYYTNYKDGWPLATIEGNLGTVQGEDVRTEMIADDAPWTEGNDQYNIDGLLYDTVAAGLSEDDPTTTNWEESKDLLAQGEIGSMVLGSWAVSQMQDAAEKAGKPRDTIGFWPMPWAQDGAFTSVTASDKFLAINKNSDNKATARAWIDWFTEDSGFAASQGAISPVISDPAPDTLSDFDALGVTYLELAPDPVGKEAVINDIANEAEIDLFGNSYRQKLIDAARGAGDGDKQSLFDDLNSRWAAARADVAE